MSQWLSRMYAEHGASYVRLCGAIAVGIVIFALTPISTLVTARYAGMTLAQWSVNNVISLPLTLLCALIGTLGSRRQLRLVSDWAAGRREGLSPAEVASAAHALPRRLFLISVTTAAFTVLPFGVFLTLAQTHRMHPGDFVLWCVGGTLFSIWGVVLLWVWGELSMRPVLADLSHADPTVDAVGRSSWRLTAKLSVVLSSAILAGACYGGSLSAPAGSAFSGLARLTIVTVAVSALFGCMLVPLFSAMLLQPVHELTRATRAVGDGNLDTRTPVITKDEFGEMTASFNEMVSGLRERSQLRLDNASLIDELRASRGRLIAAGDEARRRVERDLHDGAQQQLVTARIKVRLAQEELEESAESAPRLDEIADDLDRALHDLRSLAHGVYPALLAGEGLIGALRFATSNVSFPCQLECEGQTRYPSDIEAAVYFSCVEALQNISKHGGDAVHAEVYLRLEADTLVFRVSDNGAGFDSNSRSARSGLQNIIDRVGAVGGTVTVQSQPHMGTVVEGRIAVLGEIQAIRSLGSDADGY